MANKWKPEYQRNKNHRLYTTWRRMRQRCNDSNMPGYENYGGRGIFVCHEWSDFKTFAKDMDKSFEEGLTLERIDNDGPYSKKNCRWATRREQAENRRNSRMITHRDKTQTLARWAEELGRNRSTLSQRFYVYNWPLNKVLT